MKITVHAYMRRGRCHRAAVSTVLDFGRPNAAEVIRAYIHAGDAAGPGLGMVGTSRVLLAARFKGREALQRAQMFCQRLDGRHRLVYHPEMTK